MLLSRNPTRWPRYRPWACFSVYFAAGMFLAWLIAPWLVALSEAGRIEARDGWLAGLPGRMAASGWLSTTAALGGAALAYGVAQIGAATLDQRWLCPGGEARRDGDRGWALLCARPDFLYGPSLWRSEREARLMFHIDYGVERAHAPLTASLWALATLGALGVLAGIGESLATPPGVAAKAAIWFALDSATLAIIGVAGAGLTRMGAGLSLGPVARARRELNPPQTKTAAAPFTPGANIWPQVPWTHL